MLCCKCNKNLAVVYITKLDTNGKTINEGYCLSCAQELNLGPVNDIMKNMGINAEEMDGLNREMNAMLEEMGDDFDLEDGMRMLRGEMPDADEDSEDTEDDAPENMSRSMQKNPFEFMNKIFGENRGENTDTEKDKKNSSVEKGKTNRKRKHLDTYGVNLTEKARRGEIDMVIGRETEMARTAQILNRRTKNNPCLIGEPGVGKTAIAEGLALKIVKGDVPAKLLSYEIYLLDMTAVVAGTQFRGQFESRLRNIIEEVKKAGNIILVIDEIHTIASAGDAEGGMNAGNILKPALSRG